jgi:hypothetical protein
VEAYLDHPAVQGGVAPLVAGIVVAFALVRTRFAGLAILAGYATVVALTTGFHFSPLSVSRKILLCGLASPVIGVLADLVPRAGRMLAPVFSLAAGAAAFWIFLPVLQQKDAGTAWALAFGLALLAGVVTLLMVQLRDDGVRASAAGLGLGLGVGIAALLSASTGFLLNGVALAAASGALLLAEMITGRTLKAGFTATLPIGLLAALFAGATFVLAALPWYALPLLALVPLLVRVPMGPRWPVWIRALLAGVLSVAAGGSIIAAAWYAARGGM